MIMRVNKMKFQRNDSARVLSLDLYWENKTYKLKRSIEGDYFRNQLTNSRNTESKVTVLQKNTSMNGTR